MRRSVPIASLLALLTLSGCSWDCGTVRRTLASGTVTDAAGVALATANVDLSENVGPSYYRFSVSATGIGSSGAPLKGHVTRARLVTEGGELLGEVPTGTETLYLTVIVALNVDVSRSDYERIRGAVLGGRTRFIIDTDLPGREHIETVMGNAGETTGPVGRCSPQ